MPRLNRCESRRTPESSSPLAGETFPCNDGPGARGRLRVVSVRMLAALIGCLMATGMAHAQSTDPVWSATMTVGESTYSGGRGYSFDAFNNAIHGSLDPTDFSHGEPPSDRRVFTLSAVGSTGVTFAVTDTNYIATTVPSDWVLVWAGESLPISAAIRGANSYRWQPGWLSSNASSLDADNLETTLTVGASVAVCLRDPDQTCPNEGTTTYDPAEDPANAKLSTLSITDRAGNPFGLVPAFDSATFAYTALIPASVINLKVIATTVNPNAEIKVQSAGLRCMEVGTTDCIFNRRADRFVLIVGVTAENGAIDVYKVTVESPERLGGWFTKVPSSHDASTAFTVKLKFAEDISTPLSNLGEAIEVTGGTASNVRSLGGSSSRYAVDITPDSAVPVRIRVRATERCGQSHAICSEGAVFTRGLSRWVSTADDARLRALWLEGGNRAWVAREPAFDPDTTGYVAEVGHHRSELTLHASPYTRGATVTVTSPAGTFTATDRWDGGKTAQLDVPEGSTTWKVTVDSADRTVTKNYEITVNRTPKICYGNSPEAHLESFTLAPVGGTLGAPVPSVQPSQRIYTAYVTNGTTHADVTAAGVHPDATVSIETGWFTPLAQPVELRNVTWVSIWVRTEVDDKCYVSRYGLKIVRLPAGQTAPATGVGPLMAGFQGAPASHDGSSAFSVWVAFSEDVDPIVA